jgi:hypothetical protein
VGAACSSWALPAISPGGAPTPPYNGMGVGVSWEVCVHVCACSYARVFHCSFPAGGASKSDFLFSFPPRSEEEAHPRVDGEPITYPPAGGAARLIDLQGNAHGPGGPP